MTPIFNRLRLITHDPRIMYGRPCVRDTRITVASILRELGQGCTVADIVRSYQLDDEDVFACLDYAAVLASNDKGGS